MWERLRGVARPDSRFHWDFGSFIPDFEGSDRCAEYVRELDVYQATDVVFVTPDNCMESLRRAVLDDGKTLLTTTYGISRGFFVAGPADVPIDGRDLAATLDGLERFARPVTVADLSRLDPLPLLVTGASAVTSSGLRLGKGHGYFDLEWAMLWELGAVDAEVEVVAVAHDCQVIDDDTPPAPHDVFADWLATPNGLRRLRSGTHSPGAVRWDQVDDTLLAAIPVLDDVRRRTR